MAFTTSYWPADTSEPVADLTVGELIRAAAAEAPDQIALTGGADGQRRRWTYAELLADAERAAWALLERFEPGERVAVWAPNIPEWVVLELGAALGGMVLVTVNPAFQAQEVAYVLDQSRSAGLFYTAEFRGNPMASIVEQIAPERPHLRDTIPFSGWADLLDGGASRSTQLPTVAPGDPVQIQYTSGTTGRPKGALLHHRGVVTNAGLSAARCEVPAGAGWVNPMPLFHTGGCVLAALGAIARRCNHVLVYQFDPVAILDLVEQERPYLLGGVPTMLIAIMEQLARDPRDLSSLGCVLSGGSTVPAELVRRIESGLGVRFSIVFGQTELSPVVTQTRLDDSADDKADTIGQPLPQVECKIVDPFSGDTVPVGVDGEFCARGYQLMLEYFEQPEETAATLDTEGWLHTGDLCRMDDRGYFTVTGRLKEMIIRGGENLYPREIEDCLFAHPGVAEVAVIGVPDPRWGEEVAAVVRVADGRAAPSVAELRTWCREQLAPQKTPSRWFTAEEFPLTGSGKIQKFVLQEWLEKGTLDRM